MRFKHLLASMAAALAVSLTVLGLGAGVGRAQQSDEEQVKAVAMAFAAAITARDIAKMEAVWAQEPYVTSLNPRDKAIAVGWPAVRKGFEDVNNFWAEVKVTIADGPRLRIGQGMATSLTIITVEGKNKAGQALSFKVFGSQAFEKKGDRWLMISNHASRIPD